jgi:protease-4
MFRESEKFSDTERAKFEEFLQSTYSDFTSKVAKGRGKEQTYIDSIGQGRVWTGAQGKERGLVDEYGGLDKAIEIAKQLAKIPAESGIERVVLPQPPTLLQQLMSGDDSGDQASAEAKQKASLLSALPEDVRETLRYAELLDRAGKGEAIYLMPFRLRIK